LCTPAIRPNPSKIKKSGTLKNSLRHYLKGGLVEDAKCVEDGKYKKFVVLVKMFK